MHTRTVYIEGIGAVTMQGSTIAELRRRYPRTPEEAAQQIAELEAAEASGRGSLTAFAGDALAGELAGQSVTPKLSVGTVKMLPASDRQRLNRALLEAHPETQALLVEGS
jgi:hypothetical protein